MAAPEARFWIDEATGQAVLHGLEDPDANKRAAVYREWSEEHGGGDVFEAMHEPTGFPNHTDTSISFNDGSLTLTVAKTNGSFDIYIKGDKYTFTVNQTKTITDTEGIWWFYFNTSGELTAAQVAPDFRDNALVALIYWDATNKAALDLAEERHGVTMDGATHSLLHYTVGTRWESGLAAGDYTIAGDGSADADAQLSIADGVVDDEDLPTVITDDSPQNLDPIAYIPVYYLDGATPDWRKTTADAFPVMDHATDEISYNLDTAGTWSQPSATNNYYVAMWLFASTNVAEPVIAILGQRQDSKLGDAQENNLYESLVFNTLPFQELKLIYRLIFRTRYPQYANTPHCKLVDIQDLRSVSNLPAGTYVATAHSSLTGRSDRYSHPASAISVDLTNLDHFLSTLVAPTTDDVQQALELLDEIFEADRTFSNAFHLYFYDSGLGIHAPADSILQISADGHLRIGSSAQDHLTGTADSLLVSGKFEVDSTAYFDNGVELYGQAIIYNATNSRLQFYETAVGDGLVAEMRYDTDQALLAVGAPLGRQIIVSDAANYTKDYDHAVQTNPTFYVHSATDPDSAADEWWSIAHDVTDAIMNWGSGLLRLSGGNVRVDSTNAVEFYDAAIYIQSPADTIGRLVADGYWQVGTGTPTHIAGTANSFHVSGKSEFDDLVWHDDRIVMDTTNEIRWHSDATRFRMYAASSTQLYLYCYREFHLWPSSTTGSTILQIRQTATDGRTQLRWAGPSVFTVETDSVIDQVGFIIGAAGGRQIVLTDFANRNHADLGQAVQTNPTLYGTSATAFSSETDEWWSITHNVTNAVFAMGSGQLYIGPTANQEAAAAKWHTTVAGTEYAGSDAAGYYDIHALTAARFNADLDVNSQALLSVASITMDEDAWIGIAVDAERIVFDGSGDAITVSAASLVVAPGNTWTEIPLRVTQANATGAVAVAQFTQIDGSEAIFDLWGQVFTSKSAIDGYVRVDVNGATRYLRLYEDP